MKFRVTTETKNRIKRFRKNKRAFWSLVVLVVAYALSLTSPWTVNDEPLYSVTTPLTNVLSSKETISSFSFTALARNWPQ